jgi:hypothetical protein
MTENSKIALAGIVATAAVGIAGIAASWLIAHNDRATQQGIARDSRSYDRRVAIYLDALRFAEDQKRPFDRFFLEDEDPGDAPDFVFAIRLPTDAPATLVTRLHIFGSANVRQTFARVERRSKDLSRVPGQVSFTKSGQLVLRVKAFARYNKKLLDAYQAYAAELENLTAVINRELGP